MQQGTADFSFFTSGPILNDGGTPVVPSGDVTVIVGGTNFIVPLAALVRRGATDATSTWNYSRGTEAVPGLQQFTINNTTRSFAIRLVGLSGSGIPVIGKGGTSHKLPLSLVVPSADGTKRFETVTEIKRAGIRSPRWAR